MKRSLIAQPTIPRPTPSFENMSWVRDDLTILSDQHTITVLYRGCRGDFSKMHLEPWILLVVLQYEKFEFTPKPLSGKRPKASARKIGKGASEIRIEFQEAVFRCISSEFRAYAFLDDEFADEPDLEVSPSALVSKRAYFERQFDGAHYPVWDRLIAEGRTRTDLWLEIQEKYLFRYNVFFRVEADWGGTGIWEISFPGGYGTNPNYSYEWFKLPGKLVKRFNKWTEYFQSMDPCISFEEQGFNQKWFDTEGERLAAELAKRVDKRTYVEYHPLIPAGSVHR